MKNLFFLSLFFVSFFSKGQSIYKGKVIDSSQNPIGFVTIKGEDNSIYFSNSDGDFRIYSDSKSKNFTFSCVGFETKILNLDSVNQIIILNNINYYLDEVTVNNKSQITKSRTVGISKFGIGNFLPAPRFQYCVFISNNNKEEGIIKSVSIFMRQPAGGSVSGPFRLRLYTIDPIYGKPDKDLLNKNLIINANKQFSWCTIDLLSYNLTFPKNGFFIAMEILPQENYEKGDLKKSGSYSNEYNYPSLGYVKTKKNNISWVFHPYNRSENGRWSQVKSFNFSIQSEIITYK